MKFCTTLAAILAIAAAISAAAQTPAAGNRAQLSGTVTAVNADAKQLTLKSDKGDDVTVSTTDRTLILRIPPGETDPKKGSKIALSALSAGDRAVIIGPTPSDPKTWAATAVLVMSKGDVASLQQKDQDDWKKRGTTGTVTAIDAAAKTVIIKSGSHTFTVQPSDKTSFQRYSLDSARFSDAKPSTFRRNQDRRPVARPRQQERRRHRHPGREDRFRKLPPDRGHHHGDQSADRRTDRQGSGHQEAAHHQGRRRFHHAKAARPGGPHAGAPLCSGRARRAPPQAPGGGGGGGGRGGDVGQMLDNLPAMPISELKPGDAIMVSTTQGTDPGRVTAITLLAGVEPLLTASPTATRDIMSGWNLGGGGDAGQ